MSAKQPTPMLQFLLWVAARPRCYGETMDAWRTSCPRLSVWEDASSDGLVELLACAGAQRECPVVVTEAGEAFLKAAR